MMVECTLTDAILLFRVKMAPRENEEKMVNKENL